MAKGFEDKELVDLAKSGDREAYRQIVEKYQNRAFSMAFDILRSREDAEDVVQEAFVKVYLSLQSFKGQSAFYTWLYRIVYNMAIDVKRKHARRGKRAGDITTDEYLESQIDSGYVSGAESPDEMIDRKRDIANLRIAMEQLSDQHRAVLVLRDFEGVDYTGIAKILGVSKGTVMSRLHYARKRLQSVMTGAEREEQGVIDVASNEAAVGKEELRVVSRSIVN